MRSVVSGILFASCAHFYMGQVLRAYYGNIITSYHYLWCLANYWWERERREPDTELNDWGQEPVCFIRKLQLHAPGDHSQGEEHSSLPRSCTRLLWGAQEEELGRRGLSV